MMSPSFIKYDTGGTMRAAFLIWSSLLILAHPTTLRAQENPHIPGMVLQKGEAAPEAGAFFSGDALISLAGALRELDFLQKQSNILSEWIKAKGDQITALNDAMKALEQARQNTAGALQKSEQAQRNWECINVLNKEQVAALKEALAVAEKKAQARLGWEAKEVKVLITLPPSLEITYRKDQ